MEALKVAIADDNENMLKVTWAGHRTGTGFVRSRYGDEWRRYISHH